MELARHGWQVETDAAAIEHRERQDGAFHSEVLAEMGSSPVIDLAIGPVQHETGAGRR